MSLREFAKSHLSDDQRQGLRRALNAVTSNPFYLRLYRMVRRAGIESRLAPLPGGRTWRSMIPLDLHYALQRGTIDYRYRGIPMLKYPFEIALYTRLIWETKPKTIVEIGSKAGGSALWMSDLMRTFGIEGRVISIDLNPPDPPIKAGNVDYLKGDANDIGRTLTPEAIAKFERPLMVIEDAGHEYTATLAVLRFFDPFMQAGEYIVIEDAVVTEMGDDARFDGGPARSITEFLSERRESYVIDTSYCDHFGTNVTSNPNGYLRCVKA